MILKFIWETQIYIDNVRVLLRSLFETVICLWCYMVVLTFSEDMWFYLGILWTYMDDMRLKFISESCEKEKLFANLAQNHFDKNSWLSREKICDTILQCAWNKVKWYSHFFYSCGLMHGTRSKSIWRSFVRFIYIFMSISDI